MVAYTKPQQIKKEESEQLRGERDQIKFFDLRFERWQVVGLRKARRMQDVHVTSCHLLPTLNPISCHLSNLRSINLI